MMVFPFVSLVLLAFSGSGGVSALAQEAAKSATSAPQPQSRDLSVEKSKIVYVSDFDLDVVTGKDDKGAPIVAPASTVRAEAKKEDSPADQATKLVDVLCTTIVKELQKAGYTAQRIRPGEARPEEGFRIGGVFGEADEQNRLRRAVVGGRAGIGEMALFVGIDNLARPDQALYAIVDPRAFGDKPNAPGQGPVISVSAYAPVAKFAVPKNPTEKSVEDTATAIVTSLGALLNANLAAVTQ